MKRFAHLFLTAALGSLSAQADTFKIDVRANIDVKSGSTVEYLSADFKVYLDEKAQNASPVAVNLINETTKRNYTLAAINPNASVAPNYFDTDGSLKFNFGSTGMSEEEGVYVLTIPAGAYITANGDTSEEFTGTWTVTAPEQFEVDYVTNRMFKGKTSDDPTMVTMLDMWFEAYAQNNPITKCDASKIELRKGNTPQSTFSTWESNSDGSCSISYAMWYKGSENGKDYGEYTTAGTYNVVFKKGAFRDAQNRVSKPFTATWKISKSAVEPTAAPLYVSAEAKYATFCAPFVVTIPEGVTASTAELKSNGTTIILTALNGTIPANTPVILYAEEGLRDFAYGEAQSGTPQAGILTGVLKDIEIKEGYVMQKHGNDVGFYRVNEANPIHVPANHAYIAAVNEAKMLTFGTEETAIDALPALLNGAEIYDLNGMKQKQLQKGINIIGGKKVIVR